MNLKSTLLEIAFSFALYAIFAWIIACIPQLKSGPLTYYLFIPAGIKLFAILICRWRGAVGTGLATFMRLVLADPTQPWLSWLLVPTATSLTLWIVVECGLKLFGINKNLSNLEYYQIVILAAVGSIANGFTFSYAVASLTSYQINGGFIYDGLLTTLGNFAGNALFVCCLMLIMQHKDKILDLLFKSKN